MPVEAVGVKDVMKGLSFIDDDLYARIKSAISPLMRQVEATAKGYVPANTEVLSGWSKPISSDISYRPFPKYDANNVKGGIGYKEGQNKKFKNGFQVENYVYNISAAGRIYETAGRLNPQGRAPFQMITSKGASGTMAYKQTGTARRKSRSTATYDSNNPFAGYQFVTDLPELTKQPKIENVRNVGRKTSGRLIYKAFAKDSPKIYEAILKAIQNGADYFNDSTELKKVA
jgi:hypothetical protein